MTAEFHASRALPPTNWNMIDLAARGSRPHRQAFALQYYPFVRAYILSRWRGSRMMVDADDACQEIFVECFRENGPLLRADRTRPGGFQAFLYGISRNIARRVELRRRRVNSDLEPSYMDDLESHDAEVSRSLDREWAIRVIKKAEERHESNAKAKGSAAMRRVELLRLRFKDNMPIRDIARRWNEDPAKLHRAYSTARKEFLMALREVMASIAQEQTHNIDRSCRELLELIH